MRTLIALAFGAATVVAYPAVTIGQRQTAEAAKTGVIRGRVSAADTGRPLRRARVSIGSQTPGQMPIVANTNSLGVFEARDVPAGAYTVAASRAGYLAMQFGERQPGETGATVDVPPGGIVDRVDMALPRGAVLTGRITDELGEPYPGVQVHALALRYRLGKRVQTPVGIATTDDAGQFRIAGLPPGSYHVVASSSETWRNEKKETLAFAATYYPGGSADLAQPIALGPSQHRAGLDFSLQSGRAATISGRVVREDGQPAANAGVTIAMSYPGAGGIFTAGMRSVRAGADGGFEIKEVPGGSYSVMAGGDERYVTVAGADIDNVVLSSKVGSTVTGTLTTDTGAPPPFSHSGVRVALAAPFDRVLPTVRVVSVESDWSFEMKSLGGPFLFRIVGLPEDWDLRAVRFGDRDITDAAWDVPTGGKTITGLTIVVTQSVGRVSGTVLDSRGKPTAAATVVVFSEDAQHWMPFSRLLRTARPTPDGRFTIVGLPAGIYRAAAVRTIEPGQWEDRAYLESLRDAAARFVLADGGTESLTLEVSESPSSSVRPTASARTRRPLPCGRAARAADRSDRTRCRAPA